MPLRKLIKLPPRWWLQRGAAVALGASSALPSRSCNIPCIAFPCCYSKSLSPWLSPRGDLEKAEEDAQDLVWWETKTTLSTWSIRSATDVTQTKPVPREQGAVPAAKGLHQHGSAPHVQHGCIYHKQMMFNVVSRSSTIQKCLLPRSHCDVIC